MLTNDEIDVNPFQQPPGKLEFYIAPKKTKTMGVTTQNMIRWMLYVFNFIFLIFGLALIITGAVARISYSKYLSFLDSGYSSVPIFMIFVGTIITVVSFFGCFGSLRNNSCMLITFSVMLGVLFIFEISGAIAAYVERSDIENYLQTNMQESLAHYVPSDPISTYALDRAQQNLRCCGVLSFQDWQNSSVSVIPQSCCKHQPCNTNSTMLVGCAPVTQPSCPIYVPGCMNLIRTHVEKHLGAVGGVAIAIAFIQIVGLLLACVLAKRIRSGYTYAS